MYVGVGVELTEITYPFAHYQQNANVERQWHRRREFHRRCRDHRRGSVGLEHLALECLALRRFELPQRVQLDCKRVGTRTFGVEETDVDTGLVRLLDDRKGVPASGAPDGSVADLANLVELNGEGRHNCFSGVFVLFSSTTFSTL